MFSYRGLIHLEETILAAALAAGIYIPHLCYHPDLPSFEAAPPVEVCPTGALCDKELKAGDRKAALVPCVARCPLEMQIPSYVSLTAQGKYDEARKVIGESVPLAASLGYICHHPCEDECRRCLRCDLRFRLSPVILPPEK